MNNNKTYCGFITIIGRTNVGKSTLLNKLLDQKVSITARKAKTTRHKIMGICTKGRYQVIYVDTPGISTREKYIVNGLINTVTDKLTINNTKLVIFVIEGIRWTLNDEIILDELQKSKALVILVINKIDKIQKKVDLLPHLEFLSKKMHFIDIIPISAKDRINIDIITSTIYKYLPEATHCFPAEYITNCSQRFIASEIVREKLIRLLGAELPYSVNVKIEQFKNKKDTKHNNYNINGIIFIKHKRQKKIIIGHKGNKIKTISIKAYKDMQKIFGVPVHLKLWVKVK